MISSTKISKTILEFGKSIILSLPNDPSREEFEAVVSLIVTAWNVVVVDSWNKNNDCEKELLSSLASMPGKAQIEMKRLIKRKKKKFASDIRAVGRHWVREKDGQYVFGCEARLGAENTAPSNTRH